MEVIYGFQNNRRTKVEYMTEQQALQDDYYHKFFKDDSGLIKKVEIYKNQNLSAIEYYLDAGEDETQLLNEFYQFVDSVGFFERKIPIGSYFIERERSYQKDTPSYIWRYIRVYDAQNRLVCYQRIDENDNPRVDTRTTEKYYYTNITTIETDGTSSTDLFYLQFYYDKATQDIIDIDVNNGHIVEENRHLIDTLDDLNEVMEYFGSNHDFSYYLHPNWMP
ncbi:hypothetical protein [Nonlabens xiamenensis]|uniref:hypothetical protein n=1 Tax=Nonlabens xiamenensis TaxID=2341043 RepID=UPI000F60EC66|nr:hypothetical protein [Nonlabens xiamenensis]